MDPSQIRSRAYAHGPCPRCGHPNACAAVETWIVGYPSLSTRGRVISRHDCNGTWTDGELIAVEDKEETR